MKMPNRLKIVELKVILGEEEFIKEGVSYKVKINRKQLNIKSEDKEEVELKEFSKVLIVEEVKLSFLDSESGLCPCGE